MDVGRNTSLDGKICHKYGALSRVSLVLQQVSVFYRMRSVDGGLA